MFLTGIAIILGKAWREETPEVRAQYHELADLVKAELLRRFPDYQFAPRRPGEIKHRAKRVSKAAVKN